MQIDILTLFPEMFDGPFSTSIIKRAREKGLININTINIRDFAYDKHRIVDDYPFGRFLKLLTLSNRALVILQKLFWFVPRAKCLIRKLLRG